IEPGALEDPADVGDVGDRERYRVRVPAPGEDLPGRSEQCPPRGFRLVDRVQRQTVRPGDERVQVLEPFFAPAERSEDLRSADAPVLVEVQQLERPLFELEPFHGTAQGDPELLVELVEVREVRATIQRDLIQTTDPPEPELMSHGPHPYGRPATFLGARRVGERSVSVCSGAGGEKARPRTNTGAGQRGAKGLPACCSSPRTTGLYGQRR